MTQLIIFTDIDGTLIDFKNYSVDETAGTVKALVGRGVPIILASSKTRAEQLALRAVLGIPDPYIVENGSAIFIPDGHLPAAVPGPQADRETIIELGRPAATIREALAAAQRETGLLLQGLSAMSAAEVARLTGLDVVAAEHARQRDFSETITTPLSPSDLDRLRATPAMQGYRIVYGGRFHTVTGAGGDKGLAVSHLADLYRRQYGEILTIGLGDSANDRPLLAAVDRPYLVQKPDGTWEPMDLPGLVRVEAVGPRGWRLVVEQLLDGKIPS